MEQHVFSAAKWVREKIPAYTGGKTWLELKRENDLPS